ncbi:MAG TPA: hypothetical protein VGN96_14740 [Roseococcus sp.]|nr:hypothetical protein [Roseococcus sp.]
MARKLRAAVVGDSVIWGQGHPHPGKPHNLAFDALRQRGALDVTVPEGLFTAQSGAQASNVDGNNAFILGRVPSAAVVPRNAISGEIPSGAPSARDQLRAIAPRAEEVEVLVMDGGANDLGFLTAGLPFDGSQEDDVAEATRHIEGAARREGMDAKEYFFSEHFTQRLESVTLALTDARALRARHILYTGYYPGLSEDSRSDDVVGLIAGGAGVALGSALLGPLGLAAGVFAGILAQREAQQAAAQVEYFYTRLSAELTRRIAEHNRRSSGPSVHYVNPRFPKSRAMYTREPWVYEPPGRGNQTVRDARIAHYRARMGGDPPLDKRPMIYNAHWAHPNEAGAAQYGHRIAEELDRVVNFSLRREAERISREPGIRARQDRLVFSRAGGSVRALMRIAVVETIEFRLQFASVVGFTTEGGPNSFRVMPATLRTKAGEFEARAFRGASRPRRTTHLEVLFDLRGVAYGEIGHLDFAFDGQNMVFDTKGKLELFVNGYPIFSGDAPAGQWRADGLLMRFRHPLP